MKTIRCLLALAAILFVAQPAVGDGLFEVESTYLGDGWFKYRVKTLGDPLFPVVDLTSFGVPFTNRVQYGTNTALWAAESFNPHRADWIYDSFSAQGAGYEAVFLARSSERNFRAASIEVLGYSFEFNDGKPGSTNQPAVGRADFSVLIPCAPAQSDNSPTNRVSGFEALPDLKIDKLLTTGGSVNGLSFSWVGDFTVTLQATTNLTQWRDVTRLFGTGSTNLWTTNQPLNSFGNFFRLHLVGQGHIPN